MLPQPIDNAPSGAIISYNPPIDDKWLNFFDPAMAMAAVAAHVESLPSSRTPERHTARVYESGLKYFFAWIGDALPTEDMITGYIGHLVKRGLKSSTIGAKYMAPLRHYLKKLAGQHIPASGDVRDYISDCKERIRAALEIKIPRSETTTNIAPLWRPEFKRLGLQQVNAVLRSIDQNTIAGLRDYALLHIAFSTGLRLAELQRITLDSLSKEGDVWIITVRGKINNTDPVPISNACAADIMKYIGAYNAKLTETDPRRIRDNGAPIWQPLNRGGKYIAIGANNYDPARGISPQSIRNIIRVRTANALGQDFALAAHDTRRTTAAIAYDNGMTLPDIQCLLRHKDAAVTLRYIGTKPDYETRSLSTYVQFG